MQIMTKKKKAIEKEVFALTFFGHGPAEPPSVLLLNTEESPWAVKHLEVSCQQQSQLLLFFLSDQCQNYS